MVHNRHSLKDVARQADVSAATVSRYLNGSLELPDGTRGRIDRAVADLKYRPNPHARRLSLGRSDTIALLVPDIANPFFSRLASSMEISAAQREKMVTLHATANVSEREIAALDNAAQNLVDGLVFVTNHLPPQEVVQRINGFSRVVVLDEEVEGAKAPHVLCDNAQGGMLAGDLLYRAGHRKVAYIGGRESLFSTSARLEGLKCGMRGNAPHRSYAGEHAAASGRELARRFLMERDGESALFVGSDELTLGVLEIFQARGIRIPDDISLVSFDNVRSLHLFSPAITAIEQPVNEIGSRAIQMLFDCDWEDPNFLEARELLPVRLIERQSVGPPNPTT